MENRCQDHTPNHWLRTASRNFSNSSSLGSAEREGINGLTTAGVESESAEPSVHIQSHHQVTMIQVLFYPYYYPYYFLFFSIKNPYDFPNPFVLNKHGLNQVFLNSKMLKNDPLISLPSPPLDPDSHSPSTTFGICLHTLGGQGPQGILSDLGRCGNVWSVQRWVMLGEAEGLTATAEPDDWVTGDAS